MKWGCPISQKNDDLKGQPFFHFIHKKIAQSIIMKVTKQTPNGGDFFE
jgi:hypothetical protein